MTRIRVLYIPLGIYCYFKNKNNINNPYSCIVANATKAGTAFDYCVKRPSCDDACILMVKYFNDHQEEYLIDEIEEVDD